MTSYPGCGSPPSDSEDYYTFGLGDSELNQRICAYYWEGGQTQIVSYPYIDCYNKHTITEQHRSNIRKK